MKERPMLFSAATVQSLLAGTKTQTRWRCKAASDADGAELRDADGWPMTDLSDRGAGEVRVACPYGTTGDLLWVREAWRTEPEFDGVAPRDLHPAVAPVQYEAGPHADVLGGRLRPGMYMPRWASRITLELTGVRVERLQDISEADALAEGCVLRPARHCYEALWESINGAGSWDANPWVWVVEFKWVP